jgi:hypothetical protein
MNLFENELQKVNDKFRDSELKRRLAVAEVCAKYGVSTSKVLPILDLRGTGQIYI